MDAGLRSWPRPSPCCCLNHNEFSLIPNCSHFGTLLAPYLAHYATSSQVRNAGRLIWGLKINKGEGWREFVMRASHSAAIFFLQCSKSTFFLPLSSLCKAIPSESRYNHHPWFWTIVSPFGIWTRPQTHSLCPNWAPSQPHCIVIYGCCDRGPNIPLASGRSVACAQPPPYSHLLHIMYLLKSVAHS